MMRKEITILQENASSIVIDDNDDRDLDEYTLELSRLLESNNVSIVKTSSCSVIIRPNKIASIVVREFPSSSTNDNEMQQQIKKEDPKEMDDSPDGIISD